MTATLGLCGCGCGQPTPIAKSSNARRGLVKGQPIRFIHGHNSYKQVHYLTEDTGYDTLCWIWQLATDRDGHGHATRNGRTRQAHVWYYEDAHGPVPEGWHVHHKCETPACVNPDHLEALSPAEHKRRHSKLTCEDVAEMREAYAAGGVFYKDLAARYGMSVPQVCWIIKGKAWA